MEKSNLHKFMEEGHSMGFWGFYWKLWFYFIGCATMDGWISRANSPFLFPGRSLPPVIPYPR
jgi:hypothetical protein